MSENPTLPEWQRRLLDERHDLNGKLERLRAFQRSDAFAGLSEDEKRDLNDQAWAMAQYLDCLTRRCGRYGL